MSGPDFLRSKALNNIPQRKLEEILSSIEKSNDEPQNKHVKLIAINRYAESNIPVEYWPLKMEKDFKGDQRLLAKYNEYIADIKSSYINGTSICFAGGHGLGKQLALDTELPTPNGFIKLIDLKKGDKLFDENGDICTVIKLHPINISPESYEIIFDDGTKVEACADHQWLTWTRDNRLKKSFLPTVKTTKQILQTLHFKHDTNTVANHSIPCTKPINYDEKDLPIDPYILGRWLGNENIKHFTNLKLDSLYLKSCAYIINNITKYKRNNQDIKTKLLIDQLKDLHLLESKHIPEIYLYSSYKQRLALVQGLLDVSGSCSKTGTIKYYSVIPKLLEQFCQLIRSLGINASIRENKKCKNIYYASFTTQLPVFRSKNKLSNIKFNKKQKHKATHRYIADIRPIKPKAMRCITVDSPSHLFLITRAFIPTHNTMTITCILKKASQKGFTCLYSTLSDIVGALTQGNSDDKYLARRELTLVDFLAIDEFDSRFMPSENAADLYARSLEGIFRTRSQNNLPTLMCTNSPNVVESFNGSLKASIDSLMKGYLKIYPVFGEDFRKKKV